MESHKDVKWLASNLLNAVSSLNQKKVSELLADHASPSVILNDTTALHLAVRKPSSKDDEKKALAILGLLLDGGADLSILANHKTPINLAGHNGFWSAVLLMARCITSNVNDRYQLGSAMLDAIRYCDDEELLQELVNALLEKGAQANLHNQRDGFTALHWAVHRRLPFVVRLLLAKLPEAYLQASVETELHGKARTPARMAYRAYLKYEEIPNLDVKQQEEKRRLWDCICAIAGVAYMPIINGDVEKYPEQLVNEKDIIFKFVCRLPLPARWRAILDGQDNWHPLGRLNSTQRVFGMGDTATIELYRAEETTMRKLGFPFRLEKAELPAPLLRGASQRVVLHASPQLFQSAPRDIRVITDYVDGGTVSPSGEAYSPLFQFSPPPPSSASTIKHSPAIPIKRRVTEDSSTLHPASLESRTPSPASSPKQVLDRLFSGASTHPRGSEGSVLNNPSRFSSTY